MSRGSCRERLHRVSNIQNIALRCIAVWCSVLSRVYCRGHVYRAQRLWHAGQINIETNIYRVPSRGDTYAVWHTRRADTRRAAHQTLRLDGYNQLQCVAMCCSVCDVRPVLRHCSTVAVCWSALQCGFSVCDALPVFFNRPRSTQQHVELCVLCTPKHLLIKLWTTNPLSADISIYTANEE